MCKNELFNTYTHIHGDPKKKGKKKVDIFWLIVFMEQSNFKASI